MGYAMVMRFHQKEWTLPAMAVAGMQSRGATGRGLAIDPIKTSHPSASHEAAGKCLTTYSSNKHLFM